MRGCVPVSSFLGSVSRWCPFPVASRVPLRRKLPESRSFRVKDYEPLFYYTAFLGEFLRVLGSYWQKQLWVAGSTGG